MSVLSFKITEEEKTSIIDRYQQFQIENSGLYIVFFAKKDETTITIYSSKKGLKVVFAGEAEKEALECGFALQTELKLPQKSIVSKEWTYLDSQIGSDEVGVGDFLLPLVVVAAYVNEMDIAKLKMMGVKDSKKLSDKKILEIAPALLKEFHYSKLTVSNEKYSALMLKGENANSIKAKMHNRALNNVHKEFPEVNNVFIDQFVEEKKYFVYLENDSSSKEENVLFKTKGESYFPSVALASVLARYAFLKEKEKLEKKYGLSIPLGSGKEAKEFAIEFAKKFGLDELKKIAKTSFKTFKEVEEKIEAI